MRRYILSALCGIIIFSLLSGNSSAREKLTVAVAANALYVFEELSARFAADHNVDIIPVVSSSGKLTAQIKHGAPYDLFVSADMTYPMHLYEEGFAMAPPAVYAAGVLVLWTVKDLDLSEGLAVLEYSAVKKIALAHPDLAPYGQAAIQALQNNGIFSSVEKKLVYGESISQTTQYIESGAADAGFTALSVVLSPNMKGRGNWIEVDPASYDPIMQGVVILKYGSENNPDLSREFYDFLFTDEARYLFKRYGYKTNE